MSFLTTLLIDIIYGVAIGFVYSILTVVSRSQYGGRFLLGEAKKTDLYSELNRFVEVGRFIYSICCYLFVLNSV